MTQLYDANFNSTTDIGLGSYIYDSNDSMDYDDDACNKNVVNRFGAILTLVFFTIVIIFSCLGNTLVLWILIKYENLSSLTNSFLINLAISDLIFTIGLPFWAFDHIWGWSFGEEACKLVSFIFFLGYYSSIIFLTVMTMHRYMAVMHPLSVVLNRKIRYCTVSSALIWLISFSAAIPEVMFKTVKTVGIQPGNQTQYCTYNQENFKWKLTGIYQQNFFFLVAFIIIAFCYIRILGRLLRPMSHTRPKTVKLIFCIVTVFYMGWTPYNVAIFLDSLISWHVKPFNECDVSITVDYVFYISRLVAFSHCCLNPVFYVFMGIKFRSHLKKMLKNFCQQKNQAQNRNSHLIYSNGEEVSLY